MYAFNSVISPSTSCDDVEVGKRGGFGQGVVEATDREKTS